MKAKCDVFVTTGTQMPFVRMINAIELCAKRNPGLIFVIQDLSLDDADFDNIKFRKFLSPQDYSDFVKSCRVIVSHAGMGSIITAHEEQKPIVIMAREFSRGEHRNDHQMSTLKNFSGTPGVYCCDENTLGEILTDIDSLVSCGDIASKNRKRLISYISDFAKECGQ